MNEKHIPELTRHLIGSYISTAKKLFDNEIVKEQGIKPPALLLYLNFICRRHGRELFLSVPAAYSFFGEVTFYFVSIIFFVSVNPSAVIL